MTAQPPTASISIEDAQAALERNLKGNDTFDGELAAMKAKADYDAETAADGAPRLTMPPKKWTDKAYAARKRKAKAAKASKRRNR